MSKILKVVGASWMQTKISSYVLGLLGVLAILALFFGQIERIQEDGNYAATVFYSEKTGYSIDYWGQSNNLAEIPRGVARAYFRMDIDTDGWSVLEVETDGSYPDDIQAYAAGVVEGALTWYIIHTHLENTIRAKCEGQRLEKQCDKLRDNLDKSANKWKTYAAERSSEDPFWHHVSLYYTQINGVYTGWKHGIERSMTEYDHDISDLYWLNAISEVPELQHKLNITLEESMLESLPDLSSTFLRMTNETSEDGVDMKKLYVAQNVAGSYSSMTRIFKRYKLNYHLTSKSDSPAPGTTVDFVSHPGSVTSHDEFYTLEGENHRMAIAGTPLRNYNPKLWRDVNIVDQVPMGPRISAANHLTSDVTSWGHTLATNNSGTACKQWLVVDFTKLDTLNTVDLSSDQATEKKDLVKTVVDEETKHTYIYHGSTEYVKGLAWIIEQVPGRTHAADISTALLKQGYWASYGLPYFNDIANITHTNMMQEKYGEIFSNVDSPRAVIFREGFYTATNPESIMELMRKNNITAINETAECSEQLECLVGELGYWSILGVRGDLVKQFKEAYGIIDTKVVSGTSNSTTLGLVAISGPPYTETNITVPINKGNIASIYTEQFNNKSSINGIEFRDLINQQIEEAQQETLEELNKDAIPPFKWSDSKFKDKTHVRLPDKWAFGPYTPKWSW